MIEKGEAQKVQFAFHLVLSKLRFMNWSEDLSTLSHILSKALSMSEVNNKDHMQCFTTCLMNKARKEFYSNFIDKNSGDQKKLFHASQRLLI